MHRGGGTRCPTPSRPAPPRGRGSPPPRAAAPPRGRPAVPPSSVVSDDRENLKNVGCKRPAGSRFYAAAIKPEGAAGGRTPIEARLADRLPPGDLAQPSDLPMYAWRGWDEPTYHIEKKEAWRILKRALESLPSHREAP